MRNLIFITTMTLFSLVAKVSFSQTNPDSIPNFVKSLKIDLNINESASREEVEEYITTAMEKMNKPPKSIEDLILKDIAKERLLEIQKQVGKVDTFGAPGNEYPIFLEPWKNAYYKLKEEAKEAIKITIIKEI
ncbi:MAG: hypothetical protein ACTSXQ_01135 [Alphaproteobacteria bacterium]